MGYYTTARFDITLRKDTPTEVIDLLKRVVVDRDLGLDDSPLFHSEDVFKPVIDHPFFKCERWYMFLLANDFDETVGPSTFIQKHGYWRLHIHTCYKNYDQESEKFCNWISQYVAGHKPKQYLGCVRGEDMNVDLRYYTDGKK